MKKKKLITNLLILLCILLTPLYLYLFFQKGIIFEDAFLKLNPTDQGSEFVGSAHGEDIKIQLIGNIETSGKVSLNYNIGEFIHRNYIVKASNQYWNDADIQVYHNDSLLFDGSYRSKILFTKTGELFYDNVRVTYSSSTTSPFDNFDQVNLYSIVSTAFQTEIRMRGNPAFMFFGVLILIIVAIDHQWPLFFFNLEHFASVKDPEPSDFYLAVQRLTWYVAPFIAIILFIASLFPIV